MCRNWLKLTITVEVLILPGAFALGVLTNCRKDEHGNVNLSPQHPNLVWPMRWLRERRQVPHPQRLPCCCLLPCCQLSENPCTPGHTLAHLASISTFFTACTACITGPWPVRLHITLCMSFSKSLDKPLGMLISHMVTHN